MRTKDLIARRDELLAEKRTIGAGPAGKDGMLSEDQKARVAVINDEVKRIGSILARRSVREERIVEQLVRDDHAMMLGKEKKGTKH